MAVMGMFRNLLLRGSENPYLRARVPRLPFVRRAVKRFLPGEDVADAVRAAEAFLAAGIPTVFTYLGENVTEPAAAAAVTRRYLDLLERIHTGRLQTEISVKLTQLGLDLSVARARENLASLAERAAAYGNTVCLDMESSAYTDVTLDLHRRTRERFANVGVCLQAYLRRTRADLEALLELQPFVRLVKGAYREAGSVAFGRRRQVDRNFLSLADRLLEAVRQDGVRAAFATHDLELVRAICARAERLHMPRERLEFQMLYGIRPDEQRRLAREGYRVRILISYGDAWFPWYMRRLAERPANLWFVLRHLLSR